MELISIGEKIFTVRKSIFKKKEVYFEKIKKVAVSNTLSLCDEVAIFIYCPDVVLVADSNPNFFSIAEKLKFDELLGKDWYRRAELGEKIEVEINRD